MTKRALLMVAASALALAGCAKPDLPGSNLDGTFTAESYLKADHGGPGFDGALAKEYTALGRKEAFDYVRWYPATAYIQKAKAAEAGADVGPWSPESLGVDGDAAHLYNKTAAIINANKDARPEACAHAQAMWDQYLATLRAGEGADMKLADAKALYEEAIAKCAAAPAMMAAPSSYTVYFGFDRTNITEAARKVLDQVAKAVSGASHEMLSIVGYTDTVGSEKYNQRLSEARARSVAKQLAQIGIPTGAMTVAGRGEHDLAKPTADGVREPLNRRATITISQ